ncbi:hypothetical protein [Pseudomonas gingeri]|uniref:hypothetical protein n=1 Tax=Pseudomonas gingeri TaxID=117681 RepID=UPI0015A21394|nr:hypothetical protein [Pseudomonas gingeri]NWE46860.1 hypothetical protein [Pseudomonas gingeri]
MQTGQAAKKLYVCDDFIIHVVACFLKSEVSGLEPESVFYYPICTYDEIKRIENMSSAEDYLLKLRADNIADHARLARKKGESPKISGHTGKKLTKHTILN